MTILKGALGFKGEGATIDVSEKVGGTVTITATDSRGTQTTTISDGEITTAMIVDNLTSDAANKPLSAKQGKALKMLIDGIKSQIYPVGSIYMSVDSTSPATLFGGTWAQIKDTFLLAAGNTYTAGNTGGSATHTLSIEEMPSHSHQIWNGDVFPATLNGQGSGNYYNMTYSDLTNQGGQLQAKGVGGDQPFSILPPYLTVYVWKRTA